mgnify:CR=1 FL=1
MDLQRVIDANRPKSSGNYNGKKSCELKILNRKSPLNPFNSVIGVRLNK